MLGDNKNSIHDSGLPRPEPSKPFVVPTEHFETPEQAAAQDNDEQSRVITSHHSANFDPPKHSKWQKLKEHWQKLPKKKKILFSAIAVIVVLIIAGGIAFALTRNSKAPSPLKKPTMAVQPPKPAPLVSTLTGLPISNAAINQRPVTGVMIENSDPARPQSGLDQAGVVFEALAEGGITRFLALYQDTEPDWVGPIRSARPYYVQWCMGFDCDLAHVGGSPQALNDIQVWKVKDLDQSYNSKYYQRITARYAPHNVYTSLATLNVLEKVKGFGAPNYSGFLRKADSPSKNPNATNITFHISGPDFDPTFVYNKASNNYTRYMAGAPHTQQTKTGKLVDITPKVVIGIVMKYSIESDDYHSFYDVVSTGKAYIFQDGTETTGTWIKTSNSSNIRFMDSAGKRIALNAGQTWITALANGGEATYK